jgi:hypothetical protein
VKSTFVRAGLERRAATESVLDICFDRKLMAMVDSVVVRSDQPNDHFLDTVLTNMDGHLLDDTSGQTRRGRAAAGYVPELFAETGKSRRPPALDAACMRRTCGECGVR